MSKDDYINILRHVIKGFDIAHPADAYTGPDSGENIRGAEVAKADSDAWQKPRHPADPDLHVLDSYPVLPDLDAFPDGGSYFVFKFQSNPSSHDAQSYDERLDVALLRPLELSEEASSKREAQQAAHNADPTHIPPPGLPAYDYEYFLPEQEHAVRGVKRKMDPEDLERENAELYTDVSNEAEGKRCFKYARVRAYETYQQVGGDPEAVYNDTIAIALHDPAMSAPGTETGTAKKKTRLQKAAYVYPVVQRTSLRPRRAVPNATLGVRGRVDESKIDFLQVTVRDPAEEELGDRSAVRMRLEGTLGA